MKNYFLVLMLVVSSAALAMAADAEHNLARVTLSSKDLKAIQGAVKKLKELRPGWVNYQIGLDETDATIEVTFWQPENVSTIDFIQGSGVSKTTVGVQKIYHNALVVELEKESLKVLDSSNIR